MGQGPGTRAAALNSAHPRAPLRAPPAWVFGPGGHVGFMLIHLRIIPGWISEWIQDGLEWFRMVLRMVLELIWNGFRID